MSDAPAPAPKALIPKTLLWALVLACGFLAFLTFDQSHWWRAKDDYGFGWLVPVFVAYVLHDRWAEIRGRMADCGREGSPRAGGWTRWIPGALAVGALAFGGLFFLMGSFYRSAAGPTPVGTATLTMGVALVCSALVFLHLPAPAQASPVPLWRDARLRVLAMLLFPLCVWFISAPPVGVLESALSRFLLNKVVTVVTWVFDTLGLTVEQQGSVLVLPTGRVGVEEACTGIRSLTGCIFAGAFLGAVWMRRLWQKLLLLVMGAAFAVVSNLARSLFLTAWAYNNGPESIDGLVHDSAGYAVLVLTTGLLIVTALLLSRMDSLGVAETTEAP